MNDQLPTGLPEEPNPLDPNTNVDVLNPDFPDAGTQEETAQSILTPGFGNAVPESSY